jgi:N-methylhydantoinase B
VSSPATHLEYDLIDVEVHQKSLRNIANEMAITLMRTSGSPVVTDAKDFSTCLLDAKAEQLAFSGFVTFHISTAVLGVQAVLRNNDLDDIEPGDAFMCNDPHTSGAIHQGDVGIVAPFFHEGELIGWGYVNEHVLDIGGSAVSGFALGAYDSYSETLAFPGTRVARKGRIDPQWERFLATNVRMAGTVLNDIRSMIAANNAGQRRLAGMVEQIGTERFEALNAESKRLSEQAVRRLISALPDGTYESTDWVEFDARGIEELHEIHTRLLVEGDEMTIQFRGGPQTETFINGAAPAVIGQSWTTMLAQLLYDIPVNAGIWRPIHFDLGPAGTIVNSSAPAPVSMSHIQTGMRINRMLIDVFSQAAALSDDPVLAGRVEGAPAQNQTYFTAFGIDRRSGQPTVAFPMSVGMSAGGPAQTVTDGLEVYGAQCMAGCDMPDVEIEETSQPGMILWRRVSPDTGGAGVHRGGLGVSTCLAILHCDRMTGGAYTNTAFVPPNGSAGGYPGGAGWWTLLRKTNIVELLEQGVYPTEQALQGTPEGGPSQSASLVFDRGDVYHVIHGGGGGVGDPLLRDPASVQEDTRCGYVSAEAAKEIYGVILTAEGELDAEATASQRAALRETRIGGVPAREPRTDVSPFAPLHVKDGRWSCGLCGEDLGAQEENWRERAVNTEQEVSKRFDELHLRVRPRVEGAPVVVREHFCPACASSLAVDITLSGHETVPASRVGVNDPYAAA